MLNRPLKVALIAGLVGIIPALSLTAAPFEAPNNDESPRTLEISPALAHRIGEAKQGPLAALGQDLTQLSQEYQLHQSLASRGAVTLDSFTPSNEHLPVSNGFVTFDAVANGDPQQLRGAIARLGGQHLAIAGPMVGGQVPIQALPLLARLPELQSAWPSYAFRNSGLAVSEGDVGLRANLARAEFGVDGSGQVVGTLSDSFDCTGQGGGAAADIANNDLPADVQIIGTDYLEPDCIDEGRAMMQIIHDLAPGSQQLFRTAFRSAADMAAGIVELADAGATIINDDIGYFAEPMFQDGQIAQAVDTVASRGIPYFSAAGNSGRNSYESPFRNGGDFNVNFGDGPVAYTGHDFDPGPGVDLNQRLVLQPGGVIVASFQWDQPFASAGGAGSANDLDIFVVADGAIVAGAFNENIGGNAVEILTLQNNGGAPAAIDLRIGYYIEGGGPLPNYLKIVFFRLGGTISEYNTQSATSFGHPNAAGANALGAAAWFETPEFGVNPPVLESFSSAGGTPIFFNTAGARLSEVILRQKPNFVATDGTQTTFFGQFTNPDDDFPSFFGTSAAAPHAAAVAALMKDANPSLTVAQVRQILQDTALDMNTPGFDFDSGYGLIRADAAVEAVVELGGTPTPTETPTATPTATPTGTPTPTPGPLNERFYLPLIRN